MRAGELSRRARRPARAGLAAALSVFPAPPCPALPKSCDHDVAEPIRLAPGHACWTYRGRATSFVGSFSSGEAVSAQMTGEATEYDPRGGAASTVWRPRDPNVEGPGGFFFGAPEAPGVLTFVAPATGTYRFSFSPCAMWGAPGAVRICAR